MYELEGVKKLFTTHGKAQLAVNKDSENYRFLIDCLDIALICQVEVACAWGLFIGEMDVNISGKVVKYEMQFEVIEKLLISNPR